MGKVQIFGTSVVFTKTTTLGTIRSITSLPTAELQQTNPVVHGMPQPRISHPAYAPQAYHDYLLVDANGAPAVPPILPPNLNIPLVPIVNPQPGVNLAALPVIAANPQQPGINQHLNFNQPPANPAAAIQPNQHVAIQVQPNQPVPNAAHIGNPLAEPLLPPTPNQVPNDLDKTDVDSGDEEQIPGAVTAAHSGIILAVIASMIGVAHSSFRTGNMWTMTISIVGASFALVSMLLNWTARVSNNLRSTANAVNSLITLFVVIAQLLLESSGEPIGVE